MVFQCLPSLKNAKDIGQHYLQSKIQREEYSEGFVAKLGKSLSNSMGLAKTFYLHSKMETSQQFIDGQAWMISFSGRMIHQQDSEVEAEEDSGYLLKTISIKGAARIHLHLITVFYQLSLTLFAHSQRFGGLTDFIALTRILI